MKIAQKCPRHTEKVMFVNLDKIISKSSLLLLHVYAHDQNLVFVLVFDDSTSFFLGVGKKLSQPFNEIFKVLKLFIRFP